MKDDSPSDIRSYLSFKLGDELFASNVSKVLNILELSHITKVPKAPEYMIGVINLRGDVLPVVDLRQKFGLPKIEATNNTCILVLDIALETESIHVGALVDSVQEVIEFEDSQIQPPPNIGSRYRSSFIHGIVKSNDDFIMLLDMDFIFSTDELAMMQGSTAEPQIQD
jgi:purine-binding chemotaxis protein CheW